ncbi:spore germination protein [Peribacillus aracenensis]|uniref:spore germination protein n=1 Tax=Peribacillus aracenensis TaxID=2976708 RepID=UPI0021A2787F|nr:spore germination protein [Peribacillus sp. BBB004]
MLLIVVALSALTSFTTPVYQMSITIHLIRFPFILFIQYLGHWMLQYILVLLCPIC